MCKLRMIAVGALCLFVLFGTGAYGRETVTLTVTSDYGSPDPPVGKWRYATETVINASAGSPVSGGSGIQYLCTGWKAKGSAGTLPPSGTGTSITFTITTNTTLTWLWKTQYYFATTSDPPEGSYVTPPSGWYDKGVTLTVTAHRNPGWVFQFWSGALRGTTNPQNLTMRGSRSATAIFAFLPQKTYFTVISPCGSPDPPVGAHEYYECDTVNANCGPTPYSGGTGIQYVCTGHSGTGNVTDGSQISISFVITMDSSVTWLWQTQYELTIVVTPEDGGSVEAFPPGRWYDPGTVVTLTAIPNAGYIFSNWSGDLSGTDNPATLTMDEPKSVTANFAPPIPVASFTALPRSGSAPLTVQFVDLSRGAITSWAWDFDNDGTVDSTEQHPSYTYIFASVYTVKLTVSGPTSSDEETKTDYITVTPRIWTQRFSSSSPSARFYHAMAYDSARGVVVLFGGVSGGPGPTLDETWEWDGTNWTQRSPANSPSARCWHAMAYDSARGVVVLFGGADASGILNDTWEWDGTNWTQISPANSPSARVWHAMAYDSNRHVVVMFGGYGTDYLDDTWEWDGTNWTEKAESTVPKPAARYFHAMAYDSARGVVVLFGGYGSNDTWEWDGTNWTQMSPANFPSARWGHAMAYDSARRVIVLFGGYGWICFDDTWEWDGTNWTQISPANSPSARAWHAMAYDSGRSVVVLFGGYWTDSRTDRYLNDTWEY
jgi:PKD repeat protein